MLLSHTTCTSGSGYGVVVNTGNRTVFGQIYRYKHDSRAKNGPLSTGIHQFLNYNSLVTLIICTVMFIVSVNYEHSLYSSFVSVVGIILACFPEGLMASVGVSFILASRKLKNNKINMKSLESIEALGTIDCIIIGKTGILTENTMSVSSVWCSGKHLDVSVDCESFKKDIAELKITNQHCYKTFLQLFKVISLSTKAFFHFDPIEQNVRKKITHILGRSPIEKDFETYRDLAETILREDEKEKPLHLRAIKGDDCESGFIKFVQPLCDIGKMRLRYPHQFEISFN